jgi:protease I
MVRSTELEQLDLSTVPRAVVIPREISHYYVRLDASVKLRRIPAVLDAVRAVHTAGKMVASICHGPWILISAGIVRGRMLTGSLGIRDDLVNAGALWVDQPSVIDGNLVSARVPKDLPAFGVAMLEVLAKQ